MQNGRLLIFGGIAFTLFMLTLCLLVIKGGAFGRFERPDQMQAGEVLTHLCVVFLFSGIYFVSVHLIVRRKHGNAGIESFNILNATISAATFLILLTGYHGYQILYAGLSVAEYGGPQGTFLFRSEISLIKSAALWIGMIMGWLITGYRKSTPSKIALSAVVITLLGLTGYLFKTLDVKPSENILYTAIIMAMPLFVMRYFNPSPAR